MSPSLELWVNQPFAVPLYSTYFEKLYLALTSQAADSFRYVQGSTLLSTQEEVFAVTAIYLATIFLLSNTLPKIVNPIRINYLFQLHNLFLCFLSLALLLLFVEQILPIWWKHGFFFSICDERAFTQKLELLYYLNYLTKFYELFDTLFLVLRQKKLEFLHWYHHSLTALLCWVQLNGRTSVSYVPVLLNLFVHVLMYWYYFQASRGVKVWWKKYLTTLQIIQFVIDLGVVYFCTYTKFAVKANASLLSANLQLPVMGTCTGTDTAAIFGCALLSSYLLLFVDFYFRNYSSRKTVVGKRGAPTKEHRS